MGCGCRGGGAGELWEVVQADKTVSRPMSKADATAAARANGGYIRRAGAALAS